MPPAPQAPTPPNQLRLTARLRERGALRYTPAGLPALDASLEHESQVLEDGQPRKVSLEIRAVAIGEVSRALAKQEIGALGHYEGFLGAGRNGRGVVFHLTALHHHPDSV